MALLFAASSAPITRTVSLSSSSFFPSPLAIAANPLIRLHEKSVGICPKLCNGLWIHTPNICKERDLIIVRALAVDSVDSDGPGLPSESEEDSVSIENLPLESKLQLKLEQKMKMKLAKKIRLRRKKLVRKRQLRKKGRWPPSKLKKNKNV